MAKTTFDLEQADLFPPGTEVSVYPGITDSLALPPSNPLKTVKVDKDGVAHFTGLEEDVRYFAAAEVELPPAAPLTVGEPQTQWRTVNFTPLSKESRAHPDLAVTRHETIKRRIAGAEAQTAARRAAEKKDPLAASTAPGRTVQPNRVTGSRSAAPKTQADLEARRTPQHAVRGKQRSDTITGEAVPANLPDEPAPAEPQEKVGKTAKQRSDTKTGEAERKPQARKQARRTKQPSRAKQSSATKRGEATQKSRRTQKPRSRAKR